MQQKPTGQNDYQEDEIDLRELFKVIWLRKKFIIIITLIITLAAGVYAFNKTPVYTAKALVEIGSYNNNNNKVILDSAANLSKKLNILFIDIFKNEKDREFKITSISVPKKSTNFIEIKAEANSNDMASKEILKVVTYIKTQHQVKLQNILNDRATRVASINRQINTIKNKQLEVLSKENNLNGNEALLNSLQLISMINGELGIRSISQLISEKTELSLLLNKQNYKNSAIIGKIIIDNNPAKPKKKLIITVAFIAGFIFSIFLVFIMNAFRKETDEAAT